MANNKNKKNNIVDKATEVAKQRVAELTGDLLPPILPPVKIESEPIVPVSMESEKNMEYFKEQLDILTERNIQLESENETIKSDYQKLYKKYADVIEGSDVSEFGNNELEKKIVDLYVDIYDTYTGNKYGQRYEQIQIKAFLPKLASIFPFVKNFR